MRETLENRCRSFIESRDAIKSAFRMENSRLYPVCASIFSARGRVADAEALRRCNELLKDSTGIFSNFRGTVRLPVLSLLAVSADPQAALERTLSNYQLLKSHFFTSEYLALVAALMADAPADRANEIMARGRQIYNLMKREHPLLTSSEDSVFAVLLAQSEKSDEYLIADMEDCYTRLKTRFHSSNAVQAAAQVLTLAEGAPIEKAARMIALYDALYRAGRRYGREHELAVLSALSILPISIDGAMADMLDIDAFLARQQGYGFWGADKRTRLMHAAILAAGEHSPHQPAEAALLGSTVAMIAAQQAAMCAVIASTSASSAASASH